MKKARNLSFFVKNRLIDIKHGKTLSKRKIVVKLYFYYSYFRAYLHKKQSRSYNTKICNIKFVIAGENSVKVLNMN